MVKRKHTTICTTTETAARAIPRAAVSVIFPIIDPFLSFTRRSRFGLSCTPGLDISFFIIFAVKFEVYKFPIMKRLVLLLSILAIFLPAVAQSNLPYASSWNQPPKNHFRSGTTVQLADGRRFEGTTYLEYDRVTEYSGRIYSPNGDWIQGYFNPNFSPKQVAGCYFTLYTKRTNRTIYMVKDSNGQMREIPRPNPSQPVNPGMPTTQPSSSSEACGVCKGTTNCSICGGSGKSPNHAPGINAKCGACGGSGKCPTCRGTGRRH